jgi:hypothetical protein
MQVVTTDCFVLALLLVQGLSSTPVCVQAVTEWLHVHSPVTNCHCLLAPAECGPDLHTFIH